VFLLLEWEERRHRRIQNIHLVLDTKRTSQDNCIFTEVHLEQEEG